MPVNRLLKEEVVATNLTQKSRKSRKDWKKNVKGIENIWVSVLLNWPWRAILFIDDLKTGYSQIKRFFNPFSSKYIWVAVTSQGGGF